MRGIWFWGLTLGKIKLLDMRNIVHQYHGKELRAISGSACGRQVSCEWMPCTESSLPRNHEQLDQSRRTAPRPKLVGLRINLDPRLQDSFFFFKVTRILNYKCKWGVSGTEPCCCRLPVLLLACSKGKCRSLQILCDLGFFEVGAGHFLQTKGP